MHTGDHGGTRLAVDGVIYIVSVKDYKQGRYDTAKLFVRYMVFFDQNIDNKHVI